MPANLRATSMFGLRRSGDDRRFLEGVKRAGVVAVGCPAVALGLSGARRAEGASSRPAHAVCGVLILLVVMELLFLHPRGLPFVSVYEPAGNALSLGPVVVLLTLGVVWVVATTERFALAETASGMALMAGLGITWAGLGALNRRAPFRSRSARSRRGTRGCDPGVHSERVTTSCTPEAVPRRFRPTSGTHFRVTASGRAASR